MIRNTWHIEGGEGLCQNTTIPRELVTDKDGNQKVVKVKRKENTIKYEDSGEKGWILEKKEICLLRE